jgi:hypothetical protein
MWRSTVLCAAILLTGCETPPSDQAESPLTDEEKWTGELRPGETDRFSGVGGCGHDPSLSVGDVRIFILSLYGSSAHIIQRSNADDWTYRTFNHDCKITNRRLSEAEISTISTIVRSGTLTRRRPARWFDGHCKSAIELGRGGARQTITFQHCQDQEMENLLAVLEQREARPLGAPGTLTSGSIPLP